MSKALLGETAQLRWWNEDEINFREDVIRHLSSVIRRSLTGINAAWKFQRVEGPTLVPRALVSSHYDDDDIWTLRAGISTDGAALRPETTATSYLAARDLIGNGSDKDKARKLPLCVWQVGTSYRREASDGANAAKLRYFEFRQAEWQCIYGLNTMADYRLATMEPLAAKIGWLCGKTPDEVRIVPSDRLPAYSERTDDVEIQQSSGRWTEVSSVSTRTDFEGARVLEIAVGLDRIVEIAHETGFAI